ncbi:GNAT family N-acetyltransferase [uncultured Aquitalea sp.]|uniref:GNAT family N-acetyltransferase n=1 Tax=uncultured Aquitalea sp. TaxID=540272 RepID=UPI0025E5D797|nr:GNAT family N-acetyltransferase [uncultured Aquitalea sp.]
MTRHDAHIEISHDPARLDRAMILNFLRGTHWAGDLTAEKLDTALRHSLAIGAYIDGQQAGFARVITDYASFAYLSDVFVLPAWRGCGIGQRLVQTAIDHPELQQLRRFLLVSRDARPFYRQLGFVPLSRGEQYLELKTRTSHDRPRKLRAVWPFFKAA